MKIYIPGKKPIVVYPSSGMFVGVPGDGDVSVNTHGGVDGGVAYLLRDEFTGTIAAGSVNGTLSDSGHVRTVVGVDGATHAAISSGSLQLTSTDWGGSSIIYPAITRAKGILLVSSLSKAANQSIMGGFGTSNSALGPANWATGFSFDYSGGNVLKYYHGVTGTTAILATITETSCKLVTILRELGCEFFAKTTTTYPKFVLLYITNIDNITTLYPGITNYNAASASFLRIPAALYLPVPLFSTSGTGLLVDTEPFTSWPADWLPTTTTWSVSSGKAVNTVVPGAEMSTNGTMEADSDWGDQGTPTTNERSTEQVNSGTYSRKMVADAAYDGIKSSAAIPVVAGKYYRLIVNVYPTTTEFFANMYDGVRYMFYPTAYPNFSVVANQWNTLSTTGRALGNYSSYIWMGLHGAGTAYFDDVSVKPLPIGQLITAPSIAYPNVSASVEVTRTLNTQVGLALGVNPTFFTAPDTAANQDFILVYLDGIGNIKADDVVNGVYTNRISVAHTYVAGQVLKAVKVSPTQVDIYYNNILVGTSSLFTANTNTYHGLFNTGTPAQNQLDNFVVNSLDLVTNGLGHAEGVAGGIGAGGSGLTLLDIGTWAADGTYVTNTPVVGVVLNADPGFANDASWSKAGTGWTVAGGVGVGTGANGTIYQAVAIANKWYKAKYDVKTRTGGSLSANFGTGGALLGQNISSAADNIVSTGKVQGTSPQNVGLSSGDSFSGTVDNYTIQELPISTLITNVALSTTDVLAEMVIHAFTLGSQVGWVQSDRSFAAKCASTAAAGQAVISLKEVTGDTNFGATYPTAHNDTYVKATSKYTTSYWPYYATDPSKSLIDGQSTNGWVSANTASQRFHIDLGSAKMVDKIYYENMHVSGASIEAGAKNFTLWGSNEASAFAELTYATDTNWTQIGGARQFDIHASVNAVDPKFISVTNTTAYRYYALKIVDNWGHPSYIGIRRISLGNMGLTTSDSITIAGTTYTIASVAGGANVAYNDTAKTQTVTLGANLGAEVLADAKVGLDWASWNGTLHYFAGDGTVKLDGIVAGVYTNRLSVTTAFSADKRLIVRKVGSEYRVFYNEALVGTTSLVSAGAMTGLYWGLFSTLAANTITSAVVHDTGNVTDAHNTLNKYSVD